MTYGCGWSIFLHPSHSSPFYRSRTFRPWSIPPCCSPSLEFSDGRRPISDWLALFAFPLSLSPFLRPFRALSLPSSASDSFLPLHICSFVTSFRSEYESEECRSGGERANTGGRRGGGGHTRTPRGGRRVARAPGRERVSPRGRERSRQKSKGVLALAVNPLVKRHFSLLKDAIASTLSRQADSRLPFNLRLLGKSCLLKGQQDGIVWMVCNVASSPNRFHRTQGA